MRNILACLLALVLWCGSAGAATVMVNPKFYAEDGNGNPLVGGCLYSYSCGTTTKVATCANSTCSSNNTNPITLNARGEADVYADDCFKLALYEADSDGVCNATPNTTLIWTKDNVYGMGGGIAEDVEISLSDVYSCDLAAAVSAIGATPTTLGIDCAVTIASGTTLTVPGTLSLVFTNTGSVAGVAGGGTETLVLNGNVSSGLHQIFGSDLVLSGTPRVTTVYAEWFGAKSDNSTDDSAAFNSAATFLSSSGSGVIRALGKYSIGSTIDINYNGTVGAGNIVYDFTGAQVTYTGAGYLFDITQTGQNAKSRTIEFYGGKFIGTAAAAGAFKITDVNKGIFSGADFSTWDNAVIYHFRNDLAFSENNTVRDMRAATFAKLMIFDGATATGGTGAESFARTTVTNVFASGGTTRWFEINGAAYDSDFNGIGGNVSLGCDSIFYLSGVGTGMGNTLISQIGVEQATDSSPPYTYLFLSNPALTSNNSPTVGVYRLRNDMRYSATIPQAITGITQAAGVATVSKVAHGYLEGDRVTHYGANETEYNLAGEKIYNVTANTYQYSVAAGAASPATGDIFATDESLDWQSSVFPSRRSGNVLAHDSIGFGTNMPDVDDGATYTGSTRALTVMAGSKFGSTPHNAIVELVGGRGGAGVMNAIDSWYMNTDDKFKTGRLVFSQGAEIDGGEFSVSTRLGDGSGGNAVTERFRIGERGQITSLAETNGPVGTFTMPLAATYDVANVSCTNASKVLLFPANASAASLQASATALYIFDAVNNTGFTVKTADGSNAAGTEIFYYWMVN